MKKLRFTLINPLSNLKLVCGRYRRFNTPIPPMALTSLASVLERQGHSVSIIDQFALKKSVEELIKEIDGYDVVGISCLTPSMGFTSDIVKGIRKLPKPPKVLLGNTHPTLFPDQMIKNGLADVVIRGEGEETISEISERLAQDRELNGIQGISWSSPDGPVHEPDRDPIPDLDAIPRPAWHLLDLLQYKSSPLLATDEVVLPIQASRGCPYHCIYCAQEHMHKRYRIRDAGKVADEIAQYLDRFGVRHFGFIDSFFPPSIEYGNRFAEELAKRGLNKKVEWCTETRVDKVDRDMLSHLAANGLRTVMFGFEVGDQRILDGLKKNQTLEQSRQAAKAAAKAGLNVVGFFVLGLPGETRRTCEATIRLALEMPVHIAKFNMAIPFPGTEFYEMQTGAKSPGSVPYERYSAWYDLRTGDAEPMYIPDGMTHQELLELQHEAMRRFYLRPSIIWRHLSRQSISWRNMVMGALILMGTILDKTIRRLGFGRTV